MNYKLLIFSVVFALDLAIGASLLRVSRGLEMHVLDVGQGDAILIRTEEGHNILVDGGPGNAVFLQLAETLPYLFSDIDLMVLTHPHADHLEGLIPVLDRFNVKAILMSAPEYGSLAYEVFLEGLEGREVYIVDDDVDFRFGNTVLDVLYPFESLTGVEMENVNNASPVIMVEWKGDDGEDLKRILLTGDAEIEVEGAILEAGLDVHADVLKAGHHGSRTASSLAFLETVEPRVIVISLGEGNSFGHPHEETLEKAADLGIEMRRTDLEGRISFYFCPERPKFFIQALVAAININDVCDRTFAVGD